MKVFFRPQRRFHISWTNKGINCSAGIKDRFLSCSKMLINSIIFDRYLSKGIVISKGSSWSPTILLIILCRTFYRWFSLLIFCIQKVIMHSVGTCRCIILINIEMFWILVENWVQKIVKWISACHFVSALWPDDSWNVLFFIDFSEWRRIYFMLLVRLRGVLGVLRISHYAE